MMFIIIPTELMPSLNVHLFSVVCKTELGGWEGGGGVCGIGTPVVAIHQDPLVSMMVPCMCMSSSWKVLQWLSCHS